MRLSRTRRLFMALTGLWLPVAFATHGVMRRCDAGMPSGSQGAHEHGHGGRSDAPTPGPTCPCHCLGSCHGAPLASVPPTGAVVADRAPGEQRIADPAVQPVDVRIDRLLPFATAPPLDLPS